MSTMNARMTPDPAADDAETVAPRSEGRLHAVTPLWPLGLALILGLFTRLGAIVALGMAANITVGILSVPHEWGWTYTMLIMLPAIFLFTGAGRSFGVDAFLAPPLER